MMPAFYSNIPSHLQISQQFMGTNHTHYITLTQLTLNFIYFLFAKENQGRECIKCYLKLQT